MKRVLVVGSIILMLSVGLYFFLRGVSGDENLKTFGGDKEPKGGSIDKSVEKPSLPEAQKAKSKDQCVLVERNLCGCSQGGGKIAINKSYESEWQNWLLKERKNTRVQACPQVYRCGKYEISYEEGKCGTSFILKESKSFSNPFDSSTR